MTKKPGDPLRPVTTGPIDPQFFGSRRDTRSGKGVHFLPNEGEEPDEFDSELRESLIHEKLAPIVDRYFPVDPAAIDFSESADVHIEHESEHSLVGAASRKKRIPEARLDIVPYERYVDWQQQLKRRYFELKGQAGSERQRQLLLRSIDNPAITREQWDENQRVRAQRFQEQHEQFENRRNEDVVRVGDGWYIVCDGLSQRYRNVSGLMGEALALVAEEVVERIRAYQPPPDERMIKFMMNGVIHRARRGLALALRDHEGYKAQLQGEDPIKPGSDMATTMELVIHMPSTSQAFVMHVGDSRTYTVPLVGEPQLITQPHSRYSSKYGRNVVSSSVSPSANSARYIDIHVVNLQYGDRMVSVTDGAYSTYEGLRKRGSALPPYVQELARRIEMAADSHQAAGDIAQVGMQMQDVAGYWDDCSAAVLDSTHEKFKTEE